MLTIEISKELQKELGFQNETVEDSKIRLQLDEIRNKILKEFEPLQIRFIQYETDVYWRLMVLDYIHKNPKSFPHYEKELLKPIQSSLNLF